MEASIIDVCTTDVSAGVRRQIWVLIQVTLITVGVPDETRRTHHRHELPVVNFLTTKACTHHIRNGECNLFIVFLHECVQTRYRWLNLRL